MGFETTVPLPAWVAILPPAFAATGMVRRVQSMSIGVRPMTLRAPRGDLGPPPGTARRDFARLGSRTAELTQPVKVDGGLS